MLALMFLSSVATVLFVYIFMPALWLSLVATDESLDAHESGLAFVASRNPFRETGPPANMAKLILLRHKVDPDFQQEAPQLLPYAQFLSHKAGVKGVHYLFISDDEIILDAFWQTFRNKTAPLMRVRRPSLPTVPQ